ncbi:MAG: Dyp-type peroxidase [Kineosporiaceae bacterium]
MTTPAEPSRRGVLRWASGLAAGAVAGASVSAVSACGGGDPLASPAPSSPDAPASGAARPAAGAAPHPALVTPSPAAELALVALPASSGAARTALAALARACLAVPSAAAGASEAAWVGLSAAGLERVGSTGAVPSGLRPMPPFEGDVLVPERAEADVVVQVEAGTPDRAADLLDGVLAAATGATARWRTPAHRDVVPTRDERPLVRNPFGFVEGQSNPPLGAAGEAGGVARLSAGVPAWAVGGSFLALRVVRIARALWDADPIARQEQVVGRRRDGTWLDGSAATGRPPFAAGADPDGRVTPLTSHVRRARPETPAAARVPLLRRSYAFGSAADPGDEGLLFMAFTHDLDGFETVQRRVIGDAMTPYVLTVGGGYYLVPRADPGWVDELLG